MIRQSHDTTAANLPPLQEPATLEQLAQKIKQAAIDRKQPPLAVSGMKREKAKIYG